MYDKFKVEKFSEEENGQPAPLEKEVLKQGNSDDLWSMHFYSAYAKEGTGAGVILISPSGRNLNFSFSLLFVCTNNVAKYEALILGLRLVEKHGIRKLRVIGDLEFVLSQVRSRYASKNNRLK